MARRAAQVAGVYEREPGRWYARYWVNGKKVRKSFGRNRQAAVDYLEKTRLLKRTGEGVVPSTAKKAAMTAAEVAIHREEQEKVPLRILCDGLLTHIQNNPDEYKDQKNPPYRIGVIKDAFGDRAAAKIKSSEISDWYRALEGKPATKNRYRAVFSSIYSWGIDHELVSLNPVRNTKPVKVSNQVIRWMTDAEEARIREVLERIS